MSAHEQNASSTSRPSPTNTGNPGSIPVDKHHHQETQLPQFTPPFSRSIRATFDSETITLYQAYNTTIGSAAVSTQNLASSPLFHPTRTTWLKPSWGWMLYRSGYSLKDPDQACILALKFKHESLIEMLEMGRVVGRSGSGSGGGPRDGCVVVQWDPERDVWVRKVQEGRVRSIQIGIRGEMSAKLVKDWICGIEDVTWKARELERVIGQEGEVRLEELVARGLVPEERCFDGFMPENVRRRLRMDGFGNGKEEDDNGDHEETG